MMVVEWRNGFARWSRVLFGGILALVAACHSNNISPPGTAVVTMGALSPDPDFTSYIVTVDGISFTRNDGYIATLLAYAETIDLAKLNGSIELVEAPAVPSGTYTSATITLGYTSASIYANVVGKAVAATPLTPAGTTPGAVVVTVTFDPQHPLVITQGASNRVHIDIDLTASNHLDTAVSPPKVTVQPFLTVTPAPVDATVMRARGVLVVAQPGSSNFIMNTRPFSDLASELGALTININAQTYFNINGVSYTGSAGLTAMTSQMENIPIAAYGTLDNLSGITPTFNASSVYVGTSLESLLAEFVSGVVAARSGDTLTIRGASFLTPVNAVTGYSLTYFPTLPVTIGSGTIVSEDGVARPGLSSSSVSVGQKITVSGQQVVNSAGIVVGLDAADGQVRLQPSLAWGQLNSASAGTASLNLQSFNNFDPSGFDFAGTGTTAAGDATAAAYQLSTGALNESTVAAGTLLEAEGIVTPFGSAPPDFAATAIIPGSATVQELVVEWTSGGATQPFSIHNASGLVVNLSNADLGVFHYLRTGPQSVDLKTLPASPVITTVGAPQDNLQLAVGSASLTSGISVFRTATGFASALSSALNGSNKVFRLVAYGQYNSTTNTFVASRIFVALQET